MKKAYLAVWLVLLVYIDPVLAIKWGELEREIVAVESGKPATGTVQIRLIAAIDTIVVYTKILREQNSAALLFCIPQGTSMNFNQVVAMIRHQAKIDRAAPEEKVQSLLLRSLVRQYPCGKL